MAGVLPSFVVSAIRRAFKWVDKDSREPLRYKHANNLSGIMAMVDAVPANLLRLEGEPLALFVESRGNIESFLRDCNMNGEAAKTIHRKHLVNVLLGLEACPDNAVADSVAGLAFVTDVAYRAMLRTDIASVETSLLEADWKPATVMAGSVAEALLLWAVETHDPKQVEAKVRMPVRPELSTTRLQATCKNGGYTSCSRSRRL